MGSPWRDRISLVILELQEKGEIQMLYDKWWKTEGGATCQRGGPGGGQATKESSKASAMGVANIGGVFVVLMAGLAVAMIVAIFEFCHNARQRSFNLGGGTGAVFTESNNGSSCCCFWEKSASTAGGRLRKKHRLQRRRKQSLCAEMSAELRFAMRCGKSRQRPAMRRSCSKCNVMMTTTPPTIADEKIAMAVIGTTID